MKNEAIIISETLKWENLTDSQKYQIARELGGIKMHADFRQYDFTIWSDGKVRWVRR